MTKTELINRLKAENKGEAFATRTDLKRIMGVGFTTVDSMLANVDYIGLGKTRRFLVDDIAAAILENRRR